METSNLPLPTGLRLSDFWIFITALILLAKILAVVGIVVYLADWFTRD